MTSEQVKILYQDYISVFKQAKHSLTSADLFKRVLNVTTNLQTQAKTSPDAVFGQLQFNLTQLPEVASFSIKSCIALELLRVRNHINETCGQQLNCALLSVLLCNQSQWGEFLKDNAAPLRLSLPKSWLPALNKTQMDVWAQAFTFTQAVNVSSLKGQPVLTGFIHNLMWIALKLSALMSPVNRPRALSFSDTLKTLIQQGDEEATRWLRPLLNYPGLAPPGSLIKSKDGQKAIVTRLSGHSVTLHSIRSTPDNPYLRPKSEVLKVAAPQPLQSFTRLNTWWPEDDDGILSDSPYPRLYKLDKPPAALLDVQAHLTKADVDIEELANMVEKEPMLSEHLMSTATVANRFKLPVSGVKHALMTHGYERANSMLIQHALLQRLSQNDFPLRKSFYQFALLWSHLAGQIASITKGVLEQQAATLCCFAAGGLFTAQPLKTQCTWRFQSFHLFDTRTLVEESNGQTVIDNAIALAEAWQQGPTNITALRNQLQLPEKMSKKLQVRKLACVSGLSLVMSRRLFFADDSTCRETDIYVQQALKLLKLSTQQLMSIQSSAFHYCPTVIPLDYH